MERKALIFNIQKYNMYDGPGVRTLVFFKGCPLRCLWCSNPEGQIRQYQVMYKKDVCVHCGACVDVCPTGHINLVATPGKRGVPRNIECIGCGKCAEVCPKKALAVVGEYKTISELVKIIEEDKPFYDTSGGGVTLGGGEVLMQPEAATNLLMICKERGINTAMETCGYTKPDVIMAVAEVTDLFLYDVKHMNPEKHHELTGVRNETILSNLRLLLENHRNVKIRMPLLRGVNDGESEIRELLQFLAPYQEYRNFKGIDLLPYHKMGVNKYNQLGWEYPIDGDPSLTEADLDRLEASIRQLNFPVAVIRH